MSDMSKDAAKAKRRASRKRPFAIGDRVAVRDGSGLASGKTGRIAGRGDVPLDDQGVPRIEGYYQRPDWSLEVPVRFENGEIGLMFKSRLTRMP